MQNNFLTSVYLYFGFGLEEVRPYSERLTYLRILAFILLPALLLFGMVNFFSNQQILAQIELSAAFLLCIPALLLARSSKWIGLAEFLMIVCGLGISLALVSYGGVAGTGVLWVFAFPFMAFLLKGQKLGWLISLLWIGLMYLGISQFNKLTGSGIYSEDFIYARQTYAAMFFFAMLAAAFNLVRSRFESLLTAQVKFNTRKAEQSLEQLQYLASHDPETNLPNLANLYNRIEKQINPDSQTPAPRLILVHMRLLNFSETSNILGEDAATKLLLSISNMLSDNLPDSTLVAHERYDEFLFLIENQNERSLAKLLPELFGELSLSFNIEGLDIHLEYALGAAEFPDSADTTDELFNHAEQAMLLAIERNSDFALYDAEQEAIFKRRHQLFGKLKKALLNEEIFLNFQPKFDLKTRKTIGVEALARWKNAEGETISPAEFIPIAENSGLIHSFTRFIVEQGFIQQQQWQQRNILVKMSLNLSVHNLLEADITEFFKNLLTKYQLSASAFILEITEGSFTDMQDDLLMALVSLQKLGFKLSIDDFGTGYSSLAYLKTLPVDELKVDQVFIKDLFKDERSEALVKSIIQIAHNFGLSIVSEGIEDETAEAWLRKENCEIGQGFGYSRPLSAKEFEKFYASHH